MSPDARPYIAVVHGRASKDEAYERLRTLLIGPEKEQIQRLRERLDNPGLRSEELSDIIAEALALRASRDGNLRKALQPTMEEGFKISVQRHPRVIADTLFPVIGAAVRKSLSSALHGMMESLSQNLEQSVSLRGLGWRIEGWRTGKSFPEIVVLRSLNYRVEQVFLIHQKTGLLLQHVVGKEAVIQDADLVSGMLTAIQDFVRDSFGSFNDTDELEAFQVGEFNVRIMHGPQAFVACVIRGVPPEQVKAVFQTAVEEIHRDFPAELEAFEGDTTPFVRTRMYLESCLVGQMPAVPVGRLRYAWAGIAVVLLLICAWVGWSIRQNNRWADYVDTLNSVPGIVVTSTASHWGKYFVYGLRDPLAQDPSQTIQNDGFSPEKVKFHWEPYLSPDPKFAAIRDYQSWKDRVEAYGVLFKTSKADVTPESAWTLTELVRSLFSSADKAGRHVKLQIVGSTDPTGPEALNLKLGPARADAVAEELVHYGIPRDRLLVESSPRLASPPPNPSTAQEEPFERRTSLRVIENAP